MRAKEKGRVRKVEIPSSSLADIAFLLLVFFLVCTTINMEKGLKLVLPGLEELPVKPKNIANVLVNAEGKVLFNGEPATMDALKGLARKILEENDLTIFSLQTSRATPYEFYIKALDALKEAGAKRISIADPVGE